MVESCIVCAHLAYLGHGGQVEGQEIGNILEGEWKLFVNPGCNLVFYTLKSTLLGARRYIIDNIPSGGVCYKNISAPT